MVEMKCITLLRMWRNPYNHFQHKKNNKLRKGRKLWESWVLGCWCNILVGAKDQKASTALGYIVAEIALHIWKFCGIQQSLATTDCLDSSPFAIFSLAGMYLNTLCLCRPEQKLCTNFIYHTLTSIPLVMPIYLQSHAAVTPFLQ